MLVLGGGGFDGNLSSQNKDGGFRKDYHQRSVIRGGHFWTERHRSAPRWEDPLNSDKGEESRKG